MAIEIVEDGVLGVTEWSQELPSPGFWWAMKILAPNCHSMYPIWVYRNGSELWAKWHWGRGVLLSSIAGEGYWFKHAARPSIPRHPNGNIKL